MRLTLIAALLLCLTQAVLSLVFYALTSDWLVRQVDQSLITIGTQTAASLDNDGEPFDADDLNFQFAGINDVTAAFLRERQFVLRVIDASGATVSNSTFFDLAVAPPLLSQNAYFESVNTLSGDTTVRLYTLPLVNHPTLALQIAQSLEALIQTQGQIMRLLALLLVATAILAGLTGWFLASRALIPINAITRTAQKISEQDLAQRIALDSSDDELGQLAGTFNRMLDRLEAAFQRQRRFTADAAHELRTPLSILQAGLDVTLAQPRTATDYRSTLENLQEEMQRLTQLTGQLLQLARIDNHQATGIMRPTNISLLLHTITDQMAAAARQRQIALHSSIPPDVVLPADADQLIQLTLNLLENAVKYTQPGGSVTVTLRELGDQVCVSVSDTGIGIAPQHLPHIFDRFYRVDRARNRQHGGTGLGLAIAQQIVQLHHGTITVVSEPGRGSEFTATLPIAR